MAYLFSIETKFKLKFSVDEFSLMGNHLDRKMDYIVNPDFSLSVFSLETVSPLGKHSKHEV